MTHCEEHVAATLASFRKWHIPGHHCIRAFISIQLQLEAGATTASREDWRWELEVNCQAHTRAGDVLTCRLAQSSCPFHGV